MVDTGLDPGTLVAFHVRLVARVVAVQVATAILLGVLPLPVGQI